MDTGSGVLVLGGSCFMGRSLVAKLGPILQVHCVNRGNTYWNEASHPSVRADRENAKKFRESIVRFLSENPGIQWRGIIDFSAYTPRDVIDALPDALFDGSQFPWYVFISTDSVYEVVSDIGTHRTDPVRESITDSCITNQRLDKYGFEKLETEKAIMNRSRGNQNVINLRLPDVLGEFDDTYRLWKYKGLIESGRPIFVSPEMRSVPVSFVYSQDVVDSILNILFRGLLTPQIVFESVNIACREQVSMLNFLDLLGKVIGRRVEYTTKKKQRQHAFLPSVERRVASLSLEKAERLLGFSPTPLEEVLRRTVAWLTEAEHRFPKQAKKALKHVERSSSSGDSSSD
jgi:nucleoside-diphosphate-sugar epimerase